MKKLDVYMDELAQKEYARKQEQKREKERQQRERDRIEALMKQRHEKRKRLLQAGMGSALERERLREERMKKLKQWEK